MRSSPRDAQPRPAQLRRSGRQAVALVVVLVAAAAVLGVGHPLRRSPAMASPVGGRLRPVVQGATTGDPHVGGSALGTPEEPEAFLDGVMAAALSVGIAAAGLILVSLAHMVRAWRNGHWSLAARVHYTLVTLGFVTLAWQLHHWNLLGFRL